MLLSYHSYGITSGKQMNHSKYLYFKNVYLTCFTFTVLLTIFISLVNTDRFIVSTLCLICLKKYVTRHNKGCISSMFAKYRAKRSFPSLSHFGRGKSDHPIEFLYVTRFTTTRCSDQYVFITCVVRSSFKSCIVVYFCT